MENTDFIKYDTIKEFLEKNDYYGHTVGRVSQNRLLASSGILLILP